MVEDTRHSWSFPFPYSADLLFVHIYNTTATIDGWTIVKAEQANRLVEISPQTAHPDKTGSIIAIRAAYRTSEKSEMELVLHSSRPISPEQAFSDYPIEKIIRLNGKGITKSLPSAMSSLGAPLTKTVLWHLKSRGHDVTGADLSRFRPYLSELVGPVAADMILEEAVAKAKEPSEDENNDKEPPNDGLS